MNVNQRNELADYLRYAPVAHTVDTSTDESDSDTQIDHVQALIADDLPGWGEPIVRQVERFQELYTLEEVDETDASEEARSA